MDIRTKLWRFSVTETNKHTLNVTVHRRPRHIARLRLVRHPHSLCGASHPRQLRYSQLLSITPVSVAIKFSLWCCIHTEQWSRCCDLSPRPGAHEARMLVTRQTTSLSGIFYVFYKTNPFFLSFLLQLFSNLHSINYFLWPSNVYSFPIPHSYSLFPKFSLWIPHYFF